jgi:hypothetical protein
MSLSIVLDSLSEIQRAHGFDGQFWGQELVEEFDYFISTCGHQDFAERVQAESE